jgi:hypothetical protein
MTLLWYLLFSRRHESRAQRRYWRTAERVLRAQHNAAVDTQRALLPWYMQRNLRAVLRNEIVRRHAGW